MTEPLDIVLRTAAVLSAVLLAGLLISARRSQPAAIPGAVLCLAVAAFFVTSTTGAAESLGVWRYPLTALCVTKAVWFWLFARALFTDGAKLGAKHLAVVVGIAMVGTWQQLAFLPAFRAGLTTSSWETAVAFGFEGVLLTLVVLGIYQAWRDLAVDLVEDRRRLRVGFMAATGVYLAMTLAVQSYNLLFSVSTPAFVQSANMIAAAVVCLVAGGLLVQPRRDSWLDSGRAIKVVAHSPLEALVLQRLEKALEVDRVFLREGLTIGVLAEQLGTAEHVLRNVINRGMGYRNFNDFLHAWRIREACEQLARPERAREPVLTIAMNIGYGSVGAFNRAFKERVGMTPTKYRRENLSGARLPAKKVA